MSDKNELLIQKNELTDFFTSEEKFNQVFERIEQEVNSLAIDVHTKEGEEQIRSTAYKIARTKTAVDDLGKKEVEEANNYVKKVNGIRKNAREKFDVLKDEFRKPLTDKEEAEKQRVADIQDKIKWIENLPSETQFVAENSKEIKESIDKLEAFEVDEEIFQEFKPKADGEKKSALLQLKGILADVKEKEEKDRKEKEEAEKKAEADRKKREKEVAEKAKEEERERLAKEQKQKEEAQKKKEAEEKAKEEKRLRKEQEEAEKKRKNKSHQKKVNNEVLTDLKKLGISEEDGKKIVNALAKGQIRNVEIKY